MKTTFLGFFIFTVVVHLIFSWTPHLAESLYGNGFYTYLSRPFGDLLGRLLPIPGIYLVTFIILLLSNWVLIRKVRTHGLLKGLLRGFLVVLPAIYIYFYWIWGFNYLRPTISERLNLGKLQPTQSWIHSQLDSQVTILNTYRLRLNDLYADRNAITDISVDIQEIDESTRQVLKQFDYKVSGKPTLHELKPDGFLFRWSTAGIYWPFSGECNVENGLHRIAKPEITSHELAHAYGVTDEGDCNLIAYYACSQSENAEMVYSAAINYFKELLMSTKDDAQYLNKLVEEVKFDLQDIRDQHRKFLRFSPKLRDKVYDAYLRANRVEEGIASYRNFVVKKYNIDQQVN